MNLSNSMSFGSLATYTYPGNATTPYNPTQLGLGPLMMQANDSGNEGKWVGPVPVSVARPYETVLATGWKLVDAVNITSASTNNQYDLVLTTSIAAAAATRVFALFQFNRAARTNAWTCLGSITATPPAAGTHTVTGLKLVYNQYTSGIYVPLATAQTTYGTNVTSWPSGGSGASSGATTVGVSNGSATVTANATSGAATSFFTDRIFVGSRIGFGTTDPMAVTQWYYISAIGVSEPANLTLTSTYQGVTNTTISFVIEDLRVLFTTTNGTAADGGLFMIGGLALNDFSGASTAISAASTIDKVKAVYWLGDGTLTTNALLTLANGLAIDARSGTNAWLSQYAYSLNTPATPTVQFVVNNFRAALTLTSGRDAQGPGAGSTFILNTGVEAVTALSAAGNNNLVLCTPGAGGGPRNGVKSLFWVTLNRVYSAAVANITSTSTTFQSGAAVEIPPGSSTTYSVTGALMSIAYDILADRFLVLTTGANATHGYYTQYREDAGQFDRIILGDSKQINQSIADQTAGIQPGTLSENMTAACVNGMTYLMTTGTASALTGFLYNVPYAADWEYAGLGGFSETTNCCVVTPAISTTQFASFIAGYYNAIDVIGGPNNWSAGRTGTNLGVQPGSVRMYYRTNVGSVSGTNADNGGSWTLLDYSGNMANVPAATQIQARLEFRICNTGVSPRITRVCFEGSGATSISNFQFSQKNTSLTNKQFAFRQAVAFGVNTVIFIRIYDAVAGSLLVTDNTAASTGLWQLSTNGGTTWISFSCSGSGLTVTTSTSTGPLTSVAITGGSSGTGYPISSTIYQLIGGSGTGGIASFSTNGLGVVTGYNGIIAAGTGYTNGATTVSTTDCPWATTWDNTNNTTYLMYTPVSIADNIDAMPVISLS